MRKIFFILYVFLFSEKVISQTNNQFDSVGIIIKNSLITLATDFREEIITENNNETIDRYIDSFSIDTTIPYDLVNDIFNELTSEGANFFTIINNSESSDDVKSISSEILSSALELTSNELQSYITDKVDEINTMTSLNIGDKNLLLIMCAASYHLSTIPAEDLQIQLRRPPPNDVVDIGASAGAFGGMVIGGIIGSAICGPTCGVIGTIVGTFIGTLVGAAIS